LWDTLYLTKQKLIYANIFIAKAYYRKESVRVLRILHAKPKKGKRKKEKRLKSSTKYKAAAKRRVQRATRDTSVQMKLSLLQR
jgi:hypothetical protein